jgi:hypothetical protein
VGQSMLTGREINNLRDFLSVLTAITLLLCPAGSASGTVQDLVPGIGSSLLVCAEACP